MKNQSFSTGRLFLGSLLLLLSSMASAQQLSVCELRNKVESNKVALVSQYSEISVALLKRDLDSECQLQLRFQKIKEKLNLENTRLYKALRFLDRGTYESAKRGNSPINKAFQTYRSMLSLPVDQQSDEIWINFVTGYAQIKRETEKFARGQRLTFADLKSVHSGFYSYSKEMGDHAHEPMPGQILFEFAGAEPVTPIWWKLNEPATSSLISDMAAMNYSARAWGMLDGTEPVNGVPIYLVRLDQNAVSRANISQHRTLMNNWVKFVNGYQTFLASGFATAKPEKLPLMSPLRFALYTQKFFVSIHPFSEGNGRISRFYQDLILNAYGLPSGPSGDLSSDDTLSNWENYYELGRVKFEAFATELDACTKVDRRANYDCGLL